MNIQDLIHGAIGSQATSGIANKLGLDAEKTKYIVSAAIPLMVSSLNYNANKGGERAEQIDQALTSKHNGDIFSQLSGHLEQGATEEENRMVSHIFGKNTEQVTQSLSSKSGISSDKVSSILAILAPIVMGFLGKQKAQSSGGSITDMIGGLLQSGGASAALEGGLGGLLSSVLGGGKSADLPETTNTTDGLGDLVNDFFNKDKDQSGKGNILDSLAGMFGK